MSNIYFDIRLTLALRSHKAQTNLVLLTAHGIVKLPGSYNFGGNLFITIALTFSFIMVSLSSFLLLDKMSFKFFA
jgi:hypothetical protein